MASIAVGAVKAGGGHGGHEAMTITAAANAGIPQVYSEPGGGGMSTRSYSDGSHPNNHYTAPGMNRGGPGGHGGGGGGGGGGAARQHTPFDEDGYWREVK